MIKNAIDLLMYKKLVGLEFMVLYPNMHWPIFAMVDFPHHFKIENILYNLLTKTCRIIISLLFCQLQILFAIIIFSFYWSEKYFSLVSLTGFVYTYTNFKYSYSNFTV